MPAVTAWRRRIRNHQARAWMPSASSSQADDRRTVKRGYTPVSFTQSYPLYSRNHCRAMVIASDTFRTLFRVMLRAAGGARTHDRRIMRTTAQCNTCASCIYGTGYRTDGTRRAGIKAISAAVTQRSGRDSSTTVARLTIWLREIRNQVHEDRFCLSPPVIRQEMCDACAS